MSKRLLVLMCSIFLIVPLLFMGCSGDNGSDGAAGATGATGATGGHRPSRAGRGIERVLRHLPRAKR